MTEPIITLYSKPYKDIINGAPGWFLKDMVVKASNGGSITVPLSGFYFGEYDRNGKWVPYTLESKDQAPEETRARMIVESEDQPTQVEAAIKWLANVYENRLVNGSDKPVKEEMDLPTIPISEPV